ncbi:hypothetical protein Peur_055424 [Populus x canadensis]
MRVYVCVCVCVCVCMHACMYVLLKQEGVRRSEREKKKKASNQLGLRRKVSPQKAWDQYLVWAFCLLGFSLKCSSYILACLLVLELKT